MRFTPTSTGENGDGGLPASHRSRGADVTVTALRVNHQAPIRDLAAARDAAAAFLTALGIDLDSDSLAGTPGPDGAPTPSAGLGRRCLEPVAGNLAGGPGRLVAVVRDA
jgi:hypothetical protein